MSEQNKVYCKRYKQKHPEKIKEYKEKHRNEIKEYNKRRYNKRSHEIKERSKIYYHTKIKTDAEAMEKRREYYRKWREENRDKYTAYLREYRKKKGGANNGYTDV